MSMYNVSLGLALVCFIAGFLPDSFFRLPDRLKAEPPEEPKTTETHSEDAITYKLGMLLNNAGTKIISQAELGRLEPVEARKLLTSASRVMVDSIPLLNANTLSPAIRLSAGRIGSTTFNFTSAGFAFVVLALLVK